MRMLSFMMAVLAFLGCPAYAASPFLAPVSAAQAKVVLECAQKASSSVVLAEDWEVVRAAAGLLKSPVTFLVAECGTMAQAMFLHDVIIVNPQLAEFPREVRYTIIAHELGHILNKDVAEWERWETVYAEALMASTVSLPLAMSYIDTSHVREYSADNFAGTTLLKLGYSAARGLSWLKDESGIPAIHFEESDTHPAMQARIEKLLN